MYARKSERKEKKKPVTRIKGALLLQHNFFFCPLQRNGPVAAKHFGPLSPHYSAEGYEGFQSLLLILRAPRHAMCHLDSAALCAQNLYRGMMWTLSVKMRVEEFF